MEGLMTKSTILTGLLFLSLGLEFTKALAASPSYDCEIKLLNSSVNSKVFGVGDRMRISMVDPAFILPEFTRPDGSLSPWNKQSHPTFTIQNNTPNGFQIVLKRRYASGGFVEENSIEIENISPAGQSFGAWVHLFTDYGKNLRKELTKMYTTCTTYND